MFRYETVYFDDDLADELERTTPGNYLVSGPCTIILKGSFALISFVSKLCNNGRVNN